MKIRKNVTVHEMICDGFHVICSLISLHIKMKSAFFDLRALKYYVILIQIFDDVHLINYIKNNHIINLL